MDSAADRPLRVLRIAACCFAAVLPCAQAAGAELFIERVSGPRYPSGALLRGETGTAECTLEVAASGEVTAIEVQAANPALADEARTAGLGFRFRRSSGTSIVKITVLFE